MQVLYSGVRFRFKIQFRDSGLGLVLGVLVRLFSIVLVKVA